MRVMIRNAERELVTIAQLETEEHCKRYIEDISSDHFDASMMEAINKSKSPLVQEQIREWKNNIDNAMFGEGFLIVPDWKEGEMQ